MLKAVHIAWRIYMMEIIWIRMLNVSSDGVKRPLRWQNATGKLLFSVLVPSLLLR